MNIGFDAKRLFNNFTGLGNYSRFVVEALASRFPDHNYFLFTPKIKQHSEVRFFLEERNINVITPPAWVKALRGGSLWRTFSLGRESVRNNVTLFHGLSGELPRDTARLKTVVSVHDLIFLRHPEFYKRIDVAIYTSKIKHAVKVADKIIAISKQTANDLRELLNVDPARIEVVYQGCHPNFRRAVGEDELLEVRRKYSLPEEFLLNVGTIESRKNALLIVKALALLPDTLSHVKLVIVGRPTSYLEDIREFVNDHKLNGRVLLRHQVSFADLPAIYKLAKLFVYPSLYEGFGIPLVEAAACGVPVISSSRGTCFSEAAGPSSKYVDPGNAEELAFHIQEILTDEPVKAGMINGAANYIKRFEPDRIANDLFSVYTSLTDTHG